MHGGPPTCPSAVGDGWILDLDWVDAGVSWSRGGTLWPWLGGDLGDSAWLFRVNTFSPDGGWDVVVFIVIVSLLGCESSLSKGLSGFPFALGDTVLINTGSNSVIGLSISV